MLVYLATLDRVHWFNYGCAHGSIDDFTPVRVEVEIEVEVCLSQSPPAPRTGCLTL